MVVASADVVNRAFGETPMRASPADCKSALRLGGALCLFCPLPALPLGCPPSTTRRSQPCRLQVGAPPGRRSVFILPFTCPSPWLPAEYNSALPALPTASRRSAWAALCAYFALYLPYPFTFPPSTTRRSAWAALPFPLGCPFPLLSFPSPILPADCKSALRPVSGRRWRSRLGSRSRR